ncbi:MAG: LuxR C-terminal-related transcriptional regulator [Actinomycetota bacterium]|nr:LuxR C-terminal-related transcriptional regulator [Actinomycetota bacterium]
MSSCTLARPTRPAGHRPGVMVTAGHRIDPSERPVQPVAHPVVVTTPRLTHRQVEILRFMALGEAIEVIAHRLGYSSSTIKKEVHQTLQRAGARNRTHAVALAIRSGLI